MRPNHPNRHVWVREDPNRHVWVRATAMRDAGYHGYLRQHQIAAVRHPRHFVEQSQSLTALALVRARRAAHERGLHVEEP